MRMEAVAKLLEDILCLERQAERGISRNESSSRPTYFNKLVIEEPLRAHD